ncbi:MAG: hypothetical protein ACT4QG_00500 [Sporichthyaceae bacterium]
MSEQQNPDEDFVADRLRAAATSRAVLPAPEAVLRRGRVRRRRQRWAQSGLAIGVVAGLGLGVTALDLARAERRDIVVAAPTPSPPASAERSGPLAPGSGGLCAYEYNEKNLADRTLAFDGTVRRIHETKKQAARYYTVEFEVNTWYFGGSGSTFEIGFFPPGDGKGSGGPDDFAGEEGWRPVYEVGTRILVSGMVDDGLSGKPIVWSCGFTRYWTGPDAAVWDRVFGHSLGSPAAVSSNQPPIVKDDANVDDARYPFRTAADWTTYADHVVVATVVTEKPGDRSLRDIFLRVTEVLWSADKPRRGTPKTIVVENVWGWNGVTPVAVEKRSRLEVGHTYVLPLRWQPALCDEGDEPTKASWGFLAGKAPLPYDEQTIGTGEIAGGTVRAEDTTFDDYTRQYEMDSVRVVMHGRSAADLRELLLRTPPGTPQAFGSSAPRCTTTPTTDR